MCRIHIENVPYRGDAESIFMRQIETVQAVDQLCAAPDAHLLRMPVKGIQRHSAEDRIPQSRQLLQLIPGRKFTAGLIPGAPFVHYSLDLMLAIEFPPGETVAR